MTKPRHPKTINYEAMRYPANSIDMQLKDTTISWIRSLPRPIRPRTIAKLFPRIANLLADAWSKPTAFQARLNSLMMSDRGDRQGFPLEVLSELANLQNHFNALHNSQKEDAWGPAAS